MKNRFPVYLVLGVLCVAVNSAIAAPPVRERVSIRTEFRVAVKSFPDLKINTYEGLKAHIAKEKGSFEEVMFRIFREGGQYTEGGQLKAYEVSSIPKPVLDKFRELEKTHNELMAEVARLEANTAMTPEAKLEALKQKFESREKALQEFVNEGAREGKFVLTEGGHWGFAEELRARTGGRTGPGTGTGQGNTGEHAMSESAGNASMRTSGEVVRAKPGAEFGTALGSSIETRFMDLNGVNAQMVAKALREVYPEKTTTGERAEKAVLVAEKAEEIIRELSELERTGNLKVSKEKIVELIESMIRGEASPADMEALKQMVLKFDQDAGEGLHRMAYFDMHLRKEKSALSEAQRGEIMDLWLSGGEDGRALLSPSYTGKWAKNTAEGKALQALSSATREALNDFVKAGKQFTAAEFKQAVNKILNERYRMDWFRGKQAHAELNKMLERAAEKLELARKNKGEDKELLAAICRGECKQHFTIQCKL